VFAVLLLTTSVDWMLQSVDKTRSKLALDRATHAAALYTDPEERMYGRLVWDMAGGEEAFGRFLQLNFNLNEDMTPGDGSRLEVPPVVQVLEFVPADASPVSRDRPGIVGGGAYGTTTRRGEVAVYGPSVVAIIEVHRRVRGQLEPIV